MSSTRIVTVPVPGASLHCEVAGSGALLLMIAGAASDARAFAGISAALSAKYTVVTYDMRGLSRSTLDGPAENLGMDVLGADAYRILEAFGSGPAYVFGSSGGALVGLELAARHPERVRLLVAHEPPIVSLLPNGEQWCDFFDQLERTYRDAGVWVAMGGFLDAIAATADGGVPAIAASPATAIRPPDLLAMTDQAREQLVRMQANMAHFFAHQLRGVIRYQPDFEALAGVAARIVVAVGAESRGQAPHQAAVEVAKGDG